MYGRGVFAFVFTGGVRVDDCTYVSAIVWQWPGRLGRGLFQSPERRYAHDKEMDHYSCVSRCDLICGSYDVSLRTRLSLLALGSWQKDLPSLRKTPKPAFPIEDADPLTAAVSPGP